MKIKQRTCAILLLMAGVLYADAPKNTPVISFIDDVPGGVIAGASATLVRNDQGVSFTIHTTGLKSGHVYTVWWVIIEPDGGLIIRNATGTVATHKGEAFFGAHLSVGPTPPADGDVVLVVQGSGNVFDTPRTAEVFLVIRDHGLPVPGLVPIQLTTFNGACNLNVCQNVQAADFLP